MYILLKNMKMFRCGAPFGLVRHFLCYLNKAAPSHMNSSSHLRQSLKYKKCKKLTGVKTEYEPQA